MHNVSVRSLSPVANKVRPKMRAILRHLHVAAYRIWLGLLVARVAIVVAALILLALDWAIQHAHAAPSQTMVAKDRAYTMTLICAVVASHDKIDADILRTMDAVRKMGKARGYGNTKVARDMIQAANVLGVEMRDDPGSMDRNRAICQKLGLVS